MQESSFPVVIFYGGNEEKEISVVSKNFIEKSLQSYKEIEVISINYNEFIKSGTHKISNNTITYENRIIKNPYVIPCIHGKPGESGHIQALLEEFQISFFGNNYEGNLICFNKVITKLWAEKLRRC